jgi:hypothetical protein
MADNFEHDQQFTRRQQEGFRVLVLSEYVSDIFNAVKNMSVVADVPLDKIFVHMAKTLGLSDDQSYRWILGASGKIRRVPISPVTDVKQKQPPTLDNVFCYLAAIDHRVQLQRGRVYVNGALARAMNCIRQRENEKAASVDVCGVERIRFVRGWQKQRMIQGERNQISKATVAAMRGSKYHDLMKLDGSDEHIAKSLVSLMQDWDELFSVLITNIKYSWLETFEIGCE